jgi:hypothetical protein
MSENWQEIVKKALDRGLESSKGAVPGAKLRQIIAHIAPSYGEQYPPLGHEDEKFRDFLGHFGSLLTVFPRDGQDILVAPSDRPELLGASETGQAQLRADMFEAFTRIPRESPPMEPWYERSSDRIKWQTADEATDPVNFSKIPPATLAQELEDRRAFALSLEIDSQIKGNLLGVPQDHSGLWTFTKIVKENGLSHKWHFFRFRALLRRIKSWCESENIEWREDWLRSGSVPPSSGKPLNISDLIDSTHRFEGFLQGLSDDDVKRISVPLDIVLKLLRK